MPEKQMDRISQLKWLSGQPTQRAVKSEPLIGWDISLLTFCPRFEISRSLTVSVWLDDREELWFAVR